MQDKAAVMAKRSKDDPSVTGYTLSQAMELYNLVKSQFQNRPCLLQSSILSCMMTCVKTDYFHYTDQVSIVARSVLCYEGHRYHCRQYNGTFLSPAVLQMQNKVMTCSSHWNIQTFKSADLQHDCLYMTCSPSLLILTSGSSTQERFELLVEPKEDTKVLVCWNADTIVLTFRGTASLTNVVADLQVVMRIAKTYFGRSDNYRLSNPATDSFMSSCFCVCAPHLTRRCISLCAKSLSSNANALPTLSIAPLSPCGGKHYIEHPPKLQNVWYKMQYLRMQDSLASHQLNERLTSAVKWVYQCPIKKSVCSRLRCVSVRCGLQCIHQNEGHTSTDQRCILVSWKLGQPMI